MIRQSSREGIRFIYEVIGSGVPVVLLHGLGGDRSGGLELCDDPDIQRYALDMRGHGDTEPVGPDASFNFPELSADVEVFLDAAEVQRAPFVGVSMGAGVALRFALDHPDRVQALVLVRPAWLHTPMTDNLVPNVEVARLLRELGPIPGQAEFRASSLYAALEEVSPHAADSLASQFSRPHAVERAARLDRMPRSTPYTDPDELSRIRVPTMVVGCERDPFHPVEFAEEWARLIPGSAFEVVVSTAEDLPAHRAAVRCVVGSFLRRRAASQI